MITQICFHPSFHNAFSHIGIKIDIVATAAIFVIVSNLLIAMQEYRPSQR